MAGSRSVSGLLKLVGRISNFVLLATSEFTVCSPPGMFAHNCSEVEWCSGNRMEESV